MGSATGGSSSDYIDVSDAREMIVVLDLVAATGGSQFTARMQTIGNATDLKQVSLPYDLLHIHDGAAVDTAAKSVVGKRNLVTQTDVVQRVTAIYKRLVSERVRLNWVLSGTVTFRATMTLK